MENLGLNINQPHSTLHWLNLGALRFPRVPENLGSGEIIIGSVYRELGLTSATEREVPTNSNDFRARLKSGYTANNIVSPSQLNEISFKLILDDYISTPKLGNQNNPNAFFLYPLVPEISKYSNVARYSENPWNPGAYFMEMLFRGAGDGANAIIQDLRSYLSIQKPENFQYNLDDVWARFVQGELLAWGSSSDHDAPSIRRPKDTPDLSQYSCPATLLARDIPFLLLLKPLMTRKRWISVIESYLRFMLPLDALWICRLHKILPKHILESFEGYSEEKILGSFSTYTFFEEGKSRSEIVGYYTKEYAINSQINFRIHELTKSRGLNLTENCSLKEICTYISNVPKYVEISEVNKIKEEIVKWIDENGIDTIVGKGTRPNNISEFLTYTPGRRNTANEVLSSNDQGYWYRKESSARNSRWIFSMGAASILTMVYLCCRKFDSDVIGTNDLIEFLSAYGIRLNHVDLVEKSFGSHLRRLGLVIDSPDSDGGIVIINPFKAQSY